jgi:hypothetical protein
VQTTSIILQGEEDILILGTRGFIVGTGADPRFNATTTHQQNPNYRPFRQHLRSR